MNEIGKYILEFSVLIFVGVLIIIALAVWLVRLVHRRHDRTDAEIKSTHGRLDMIAEHADINHDVSNTKLNKIAGRLQFLTAKEIAAQLGEEKARQMPKQPPPQDIQ